MYMIIYIFIEAIFNTVTQSSTVRVFSMSTDMDKLRLQQLESLFLIVSVNCQTVSQLRYIIEFLESDSYVVMWEVQCLEL